MRLAFPRRPRAADARRDGGRLAEGIRLANSRGVVAVHDKDGWLGALAVFQELQREGALTLRVWQSLPHDHVDRLAEIGISSGLGDAFLRVGYIKAFMDGTLGSQTARMLDGSGVEITSRAELEDIVRRSARAGFPVAVHAIGNLANREALDAFEATQEEWRPRGLRPRIEHAQLLAPEDVPRFAELGVAASVQFSHAPSDRDLADRFWGDLTAGAYAYRSLLDAGTHVANGSDAPIEELDPLAGIAAGVLRTIDERPAWHPEQRVTVERPSTPRASPRPGSKEPSGGAAASCPASSPTSSSSTAIRSSARPRSFGTWAWSRRWPAEGGCTTRRRGTSGASEYNERMRTMRPVHDANCSVACTADIIGAKWTAVIVHDLSEGPRRFSELERSCPGISPRTLSERLRVLEQEGILQRTSARRRVDYSLTEKGEALLPIIDAMRQFGHEWLVPEHGHAHASATTPRSSSYSALKASRVSRAAATPSGM